MLQQTQVSTVLPYYERWMRELPSFAALAGADADTVLKLWEGLGYYSRARNLHVLARRIAADGAPQTIAGWLALPGVGPYAAAAIGSIAQGLPAAVTDGNVVRVIARLGADPTQFASSGAAVKSLAPVAAALLDPARPGLHNEAMMELGATVCVKARPQCLLCPVRSWCVAGPAGQAEGIPVIRRPATQHLTVRRAWLVRDGALLLARAPGTARRLAGCWELPELHGEHADWHHLARKSRSISNQRIVEEILVPPPDHDRAAVDLGASGETRWVPIGELATLRLSGPHRRWVEELTSDSRC